MTKNGISNNNHIFIQYDFIIRQLIQTLIIISTFASTAQPIQLFNQSIAYSVSRRAHISHTHRTNEIIF